MSPFNDSSPSESDNQKVYRELIVHLSQFFSEETITERLNVEQMFILVDGVLPIEACLYYQVLPLFLDGSRLHLGMVNLSDTIASDYVRRIVSYLNYSLITRRISSSALQAALSAYLKYSDSQSSKSQSSVIQQANPATSAQNVQAPNSAITHNLETNNKETLVLDSSVVLNQNEVQPELQASPVSSSAPILPSDELTCIDPEETEIIQLNDQGQSDPLSENDLLLKFTETTDASEKQHEAIFRITADEEKDHNSNNDSNGSHSDAALLPEEIAGVEEETVAANLLSHSSSQSAPVQSSEFANSNQTGSNAAPHSPSNPLAVQIDAKHLDKAIAYLQYLSPRDLLRELLARAMSGGIGRLYFERKSNYGRILWSRSGVLQSVVDRIPSVKFQSLIDEFKRLTRLPLLPLRKTKQVELERFYNGNRVLLRFRFIPGKHGEQATLQVLRGVALSFYQQQQVKRIGQDALSIANQLQVKMNELCARIDAYPRASTLEQHSLSKLKKILIHLEQQVEALETESLDSNG